MPLPAARSRTENWRHLLETVAERGGALEVSVDRGQSSAGEAAPDIVWRVRLLRINDGDLLLECPSAAGGSISLRPETPLLVAVSVGQNRWMFHSKVLGGWRGGEGPARRETLAIALPERVERCARRQFFRISTGEMRLAPVRCWPLLEPMSAVEPERFNRDRHAPLGTPSLRAAFASDQTDPMPKVGPEFHARLLNMSGGGLGLLLPPGDNPFNHGRYFWIALDLRPDVAAPIYLTAKLAHTHLDSHQQVYVGLAFDFTFNPEHQRFITEVMSRYVEQLQQRVESGSAQTRAA
jgi:c-di-GMP-binding flagellar brake protein YcgR